MKKSSRTIALLVGMLSAGALMFSAHTVLAAITWGGAWSAETAPTTVATCWGGWTGEYVGKSIINGNDAGQVGAWCETGGNPNQAWCGAQPGFNFYVRGRGRDTGTNTTETTAGTSGATVGSTAGGVSLEFHQCQKGYQAIP